ncbi:bacillithiol system protein YtxJ [bacterium A37T11]|nr:bacillithiol system protein YtxJ [bacterium A37T11]
MSSWIALTTEQQLDDIAHNDTYCIIYKHSTRCPISSMAKKSIQLEEVLLPDDLPRYYLDLFAYRQVSNKIAEKWQVRHESPQLLLIKGNECVYHASHNNIRLADVIKQIG